MDIRSVVPYAGIQTRSDQFVTRGCALARRSGLSGISEGRSALVLLGTFASLRWAELAALRPGDIDLEACTIRVERQLVEQLGGGSAFGPPKSRAGRRIVPFPDILKAELKEHLDRFDLDDEALVFASPMGTALRHSNF
jgi:integrase